MTDPPHELSRPRAAIEAIRADRIDGESLSIEDATIADSTLSICTGVVSLDFHNFWSSLRGGQPDGMDGDRVWYIVGGRRIHLGEDPVADTLLRVETALTQGLPASELPSHPSHAEFPGMVPLAQPALPRRSR